MVNAAPIEKFEYLKKYFLFFEGMRGNIDKYIQAYKENGILDELDPNTIVHKFKYPITDRSEFFLELSELETKILRNCLKGNGFLHGVFSGDAWIKAGTVHTDMGYGVFPVQNKMAAYCAGGSKLATWCLFDCPRQ